MSNNNNPPPFQVLACCPSAQHDPQRNRSDVGSDFLQQYDAANANGSPFTRYVYASEWLQPFIHAVGTNMSIWHGAGLVDATSFPHGVMQQIDYSGPLQQSTWFGVPHDPNTRAAQPIVVIPAGQINLAMGSGLLQHSGYTAGIPCTPAVGASHGSFHFVYYHMKHDSGNIDADFNVPRARQGVRRAVILLHPLGPLLTDQGWKKECSKGCTPYVKLEGDFMLYKKPNRVWGGDCDAHPRRTGAKSGGGPAPGPGPDDDSGGGPGPAPKSAGKGKNANKRESMGGGSNKKVKASN